MFFNKNNAAVKEERRLMVNHTTYPVVDYFPKVAHPVHYKRTFHLEMLNTGL